MKAKKRSTASFCVAGISNTIDHRPLSPVPILAIALIVLIGCARQDTGAAPAVRDSAGVRIVENARAAWGRDEGWRLSAEPSITIGEVEADSSYQFEEIVGIVRLADSTIVVADAGSNSLRFFDSHGRLVRVSGRTGEGPGEFRALQALRRFGTDSVVVLDRRLNRLTIFDRSGAVAGTVQLAARSVSIYPLARNWLAAGEEGFFGARLREDASPGLQRYPATVVILELNGSVTDTLGEFPGAEMAYFPSDGRMGALAAAYGRVLALGVHAAEIYIGTGDELGYRVYSDRGEHLRTVRARGPDRTLRSSDISAYHDRVLSQISDPAWREPLARSLKAAAVPAEKAAYTRLLLDPLGNVWLSDYENSYITTGVWRVFDHQGTYLGEVHSPSQMRILEVGEKHVAGVWKDDMGVESVRLYALDR